MSRLLQLIHGPATGIVPASDVPTTGQRGKIDNFIVPLKYLTDLLANGAIQKNVWVGGAQFDISLPGTATGDFEVWNATRVEIDNTSNQLSDFVDSYGATRIARFRYRIRVSNSAITVTPKIYNETDSAFASITGAAACSSTNTSFTGTNQKQNIFLTLATGLKQYVPYFTIGGTPSGGYQVFVHVTFDHIISL